MIDIDSMSCLEPNVRRLSFCAGLVSVGALTLIAPIASAQTTEGNRIAAETLFNEARKAMGEGHYDDACPKFADSQRLDPGVGTLMNLALCYKQAGKTASAWSSYRDAAAAAREAGQNEREDVARQEASALEPQLAKLSLAIKGPVDGLEILIDGTAVPKSLWSIPMPVDPGKHSIEAKAAGYKAWTGSVEISSASAQSLDVPALALDPNAKPDEGTKPGALTTDQGTGKASGASGQRTIALVTMGVGVVGVGVGTFFGLSAKSRYADSDPYCTGDNCYQKGIDIRKEARGKATISTVAFGIGGAALVGGAVLWFTTPSAKKAPSDSARLELEIAPTDHGWWASVGRTW